MIINYPYKLQKYDIEELNFIKSIIPKKRNHRMKVLHSAINKILRDLLMTREQINSIIWFRNLLPEPGYGYETVIDQYGFRHTYVITHYDPVTEFIYKFCKKHRY